MKRRKLLEKLAQGALHNISFDDMKNLVEGFGFTLARVNSGHHIFTRPYIPQLANLQNVRGQAKPYQIRQFLRLVERYNLKLEEDDT